MLSCWHPSAKLRPSFGHLVESVSRVIDNMQRQIETWRAAANYVNADVDEDQPSTPSNKLDAINLATLRSTNV